MGKLPGAKGRRRAGGADATAARAMNGAAPAKPWAGRFSQGMDATVEAYTASIEADVRLLEYDIAGSIAHARMLSRQGIISRKDADAIVRGLRELQADHHRGAFEL